ncbi:wall-associated receptor kinase 2-like [Lycium ferocissimum]|uniref:wall-associated receptor kinase 2-like n=1 Tax=Lycium ferocissimum TaxID=112874 RepID=UPI0028152509|nr:wall-associated receptor kinase 2-like [Lycium ferocissimum]
MAPNYVMMVVLDLITLTVIICSSLSFGAMLPRIAKPNCNGSCGNISIPFPFGMTQDCFLERQFLVTCNYSFQPPKLFLWNTTIEITSISLAGQLKVLQFISRDCYHDGIRAHRNTPWITLESLFTVNSIANKFIAVGYDTYAIVQGYYRRYNSSISHSYVTGCMSMCNSIEDVANGGECSGVGCCQTSIPKGAWNVTVALSSYNNYTRVTGSPSNSCSYAFVVEEAAFSFSKNYLSSLQNKKELPLVLDWAIGQETCEMAKKNSTAYACKSNNSDCHDNSNGYRCSCMQGYDGDPYLEDGCQDIDECIDRNQIIGVLKMPFARIRRELYMHVPSSFGGDGTECNHDNPQRKVRDNLAIGVTVGVAFLVLIVCGCSYTGFQRRKMLMMKKKFFQENGGLVLQQRLTGQEGSSNNTTKIFTAEELERATNDFDKDRVIGQGGFGTVYKGYLKDNRIVAIKKSKVIDRNQIEQFINEVIVLSQINHRNVVKLLGCCLETEVPLLVYEFINNGTLSEQLHDKVKASTLSLDIRLRVATETAGVLCYLHSAAYPPIIHRDIKSVNILLDKSYTAKVSDFGASRLVPADQTELSTLVQGTLGYLDPEYLQTNQLTEKSDVYSFGVVLAELLTGRKAVCFDRPEEERSLANYFTSSVEKDHLFDILDDNIVCDERNRGQLKSVAMLAQRCLNVKGDDRPTMKEVAAELEGGSRLKHSWAQTDQNSEEIESLLQGTEPLGFGYEYSEQSIHIDSITNHITLPRPGGR